MRNWKDDNHFQCRYWWDWLQSRWNHWNYQNFFSFPCQFSLHWWPVVVSCALEIPLKEIIIFVCDWYFSSFSLQLKEEISAFEVFIDSLMCTWRGFTANKRSFVEKSKEGYWPDKTDQTFISYWRKLIMSSSWQSSVCILDFMKFTSSDAIILLLDGSRQGAPVRIEAMAK